MPVDVAGVIAGVDLPDLVGRYVRLRKDGQEWKGCCPFHEDTNPSFTVYRKPDKWRYKCFACGAHGDALDFLEEIDGVDRAEALRRLGGPLPDRAPADPPVPRATEEVWSARMPVPDDAPPMDPGGLWNPKRGREARLDPAASWAYRDAEGRLLGYVLRCNPADGGKWTPTVTYAGTVEDVPRWSLVPFSRPRPLYGLDRLAARPLAPVVIVEGEKAADAAGVLMPAWVAVTWPGGTQGVAHADWSALAGRDVVVWPDADEPGRAAAQAIGGLLAGSASRVRLLDVAGQPAGWDAADALAEGWSVSATVAWAKDRVRPWVVPDPPAVKQEPVQRAVAPEAAGPVGDAVPAPVASRRPARAAKRPDLRVVPTAAPVPAAAGADYDTPLPILTDRQKPIVCIENLAEVCRRLGVTVRYNVIGKEEEILIPGAGFSVDNRANASLAWLVSEAAKFRLSGDRVPEMVTYLADQNPYNPVATWIDSRPWDGQDRLADLIATVAARGERLDERIGLMKRAFITRWMISAVAAVYRPEGVSAHGVLVFQGEQYVGKTKWFKQLAPAGLGVLKDGLLLRPDDRDSVMRCISYWLVELGELDVTFRKSDIAHLKSFLTSDRDVLRRAYGRRESTFCRRTVFFASVNPKNYLHDETGNRRYWTIEVEALDYDHGIDMQQCWSQVAALYRSGESWFLAPDEFAMLNEHNIEFEAPDPIEDLVTSGLRWDDPPAMWSMRTATDVLIGLGRKNCTKGEVTRAGMVIRRLNGNRGSRSGAARTLFVPDARVSQVSSDVSSYNRMF